ncbi:CubicO group peptidase (beta-lactamase class C family) [Rhodopseudomonas rhenobacensis]|uniref:CubicO group peptidase (Beta-lactamase class C family) n=1 Tax=Rhodopseudomonas rhenobacensis TaxID=87461 RepID=A0A7W7Z703_9BRAD|nr:serine hydrolase domain-containing protein [Rhodopseudomonas rhenobacensis]MBB5048975.1 CubicO group peptidase (beta-lactamase class C family) [Rhodopseudomonas rhenobacensis]
MPRRPMMFAAWLKSAAVAAALVVALCWGSGRAAAAPEPPPQAFAGITRYFDDEVAAGRLPGAVVLIQRHGQPVYLRCFGVRDTATGQAMTPDTIFALHSMTKPITSVAAMMLIDEGRLALADPVAKFIPAFAAVTVGVETVDAAGKPSLQRVAPDRPVSIADLLRHTSGITYGYIGGDLIKQAYAAGHLFDGAFDNATFADRIARLPLARQPGTLWRYGHSTDVLGRVIEIISGQPLGDVLQQRIFAPLGMTSTSFGMRDPAARARMAEPLPGDGILQRAEAMRRAHPEWQAGGGGLVSTAPDYARFAQMLLDGGVWDGRRLISEASFKAMTTDQIGPGSGVARDFFYFPGDGFGFGYGLAVRVEPGTAHPPPPGSLGELKWDSGSGTLFGVDPKLDMVFVLMQQTQAERGKTTVAFKKLLYDAVQAMP